MSVTNFPNGIADGSGTILAHSAGSFQLAHGIATITGAGTIASGLSSIGAVCAQLNTIGASAGDPAVATAIPSAGNIVFSVLQDDHSTAATAAGTIHWIAVGT